MKIIKKITSTLIILMLVLYLALLVNVSDKYSNNIGSESLMSYEQIKLKEYKEIESKIKPYIVYANVIINNKQYKAEVIEDTQNGTTYCVKVNEELMWLDNKFVTILENNEEDYEALTDEEIQIYINFNKLDSKTNYFLWVDIYRNETYLLEKIANEFKLIRRFSCTTGSIYTPTKRGMYEITSKGEQFIGRDKTYKCYYYMQYSGSYLLHSFPYFLNDEVKDDRLEARVSNGCVRFTLEDSKYLYNLIPIGTTIWLN